MVGRGGKGRLLTRDYLQCHFPGQAPDDPTVSGWLNAIEHEYELIAYLADDTLERLDAQGDPAGRPAPVRGVRRTAR